MEKLNKRDLSQVIDFNIDGDVTMTVCTLGGRVCCFASVAFLRHTPSHKSHHEENTGKSRLEDGLRNTSSVVFETIKVITNEARQRNCNSLGEPKKVKRLSVMGCPGRDHATEKEHQARARET